MTGKIVEPDGLKARARLILEGARCFANAVGISKEIGDGHDDMMAFLQEVARLKDATSEEWNRPAGDIAEPQEISDDDPVTLGPSVLRRLQELINDIIDIERGLERLMDQKDWQDIQCPVEILRKAMKDRTWRSMNLLYGTNEGGD